MQVKDLILYQVATDRNYKVGDKYTFGENPNGQWQRVFIQHLEKAKIL